MNSRLASCRGTDHGNSYAPGVKQSARHGAIKLGRSQIVVLDDIVNSIDER